MSDARQPQDRTRRMGAGSQGDDPGQDPTRRMPPRPGDSAEPTRRLPGGAPGAPPSSGGEEPRVYSYEHEPGERPATVEDVEAGEFDEVRPARPSPWRRRGRDALAALIGALLGFIAALVVVALGATGPTADDPEMAAAQERIEALEAELADRDAELAEAEGTAAELTAAHERIDELEAERTQLEAQLAEAEAAAGDRDADVQAQREALDERADALDQRADALDEREAALDEREERIAEREAANGAPPADAPDLPDVPGIDEDTLVDRIIEQIRDLFRDGDS